MKKYFIALVISIIAVLAFSANINAQDPGPTLTESQSLSHTGVKAGPRNRPETPNEDETIYVIYDEEDVLIDWYYDDEITDEEIEAIEEDPTLYIEEI